MGQKVTLKIAGKTYNLEAETPEVEQLMRKASAEVNEMLEDFSMRFPEAGLEDKFAFVAVQQAVGKFYAKMKFDAVKTELGSLHQELGSYLEGIDK